MSLTLLRVFVAIGMLDLAEANIFGTVPLEYSNLNRLGKFENVNGLKCIVRFVSDSNAHAYTARMSLDGNPISGDLNHLCESVTGVISVTCDSSIVCDCCQCE